MTTQERSLKTENTDYYTEEDFSSNQEPSMY